LAKSKSRALPRFRKTRHKSVSRADFNRVIHLLNQRGDILTRRSDDLAADLEIQFKRIAQLQAEIDRLSRY